MRKRPLMYLACVFLTGLAFQRFSMKWLAVLCIISILIEVITGAKTKRVKKAAGRSIVLLSAFLLGIFHMQQEETFRAAYMSKIVDGSRITVWGECIQVETTDYGERGFLSDCYIRLNEVVMPCNNIVVYTSEDQIQIGRVHKIEGKVNMFSEARNEGNFDSRCYYQSLKIDFALDAQEIHFLGAGTSWRGMLSHFREKLCHVYDTFLTEKAAGFYKAMVLGEKTDLDEKLKDLFLIGGISHILAISGLHVSMIGRRFYQMLRKRGIGFGVAGISGSLLLIVYCAMVGSSMSTVRAVGMMLCFFLAQWIGRSYDMLNSLGAMVLYLLWNNPFLIENSGFWFSVTALLGVGVVGKELASTKEKTQAIWMSLGITLTTLPISAWSYYEVPLYSPFVNAIVLPLLTPVFLLAIMGALLGLFLPVSGINILLFKPCEWLVELYERICQMVSNLPGATVICGKPEFWQVMLYYSVLFMGIYCLEKLRNHKETGKRNFFMVIILICCGLCMFLSKKKLPEITFLDVGQGDGIYLSAGDGSTFFIDGGSSNVDGVGEYRILPFLKSKGIKSIDYWFISHLDTDHVSGLFEILEKGYQVKMIVVSAQCQNDENHAILKSLAMEAGAQMIDMEPGDRVCSKNMEITCLGPLLEKNEAESLDRNENSLVLQVDLQMQEKESVFKALFSGDISAEVEEKLCEKGVLEDVDLFKANHHGSNYSNSTQLFQMICPEYIVISCSKNNRYGHPGELALERMEECGAKVFYTMEDGQISFPLIQ